MEEPRRRLGRRKGSRQGELEGMGWKGGRREERRGEEEEERRGEEKELGDCRCFLFGWRVEL